jgi:hypothetical protein
MTVTPIVLALSVLASSVPQEIPSARFERARLSPPSLLEVSPDLAAAAPLVPAATTAPATPRSPADAESSGLTWKQIAHRVGGALVGGWLGYVGAQVVRSDWDKETNGTFRDQRFSWAAAGAVVGVLGSHLFRSTGSPGQRPSRVGDAPKMGSYLGTEEIRDSKARNAYELIYNLRMHWLVTRGANSVAESPRGEAHGDFVINVVPGRDKILVYLDDVHVGGVESMREVSADLLTSARFLDAREATLRYGGGHAHGAILLSTEVSP